MIGYQNAIIKLNYHFWPRSPSSTPSLCLHQLPTSKVWCMCGSTVGTKTSCFVIRYNYWVFWACSCFADLNLSRDCLHLLPRVLCKHGCVYSLNWSDAATYHQWLAQKDWLHSALEQKSLSFHWWELRELGIVTLFSGGWVAVHSSLYTGWASHYWLYTILIIFLDTSRFCDGIFFLDDRDSVSLCHTRLQPEIICTLVSGKQRLHLARTAILGL